MKLLAPLALAVGVNSFESPFVIDKNNVIYRGQMGKSLSDVNWVELSQGRLADIGCNSNDQCWGAAADGTTWFANASNPSKVTWYQKRAGFKAVAISTGIDGSVWVVDSYNRIWRSEGFAQPWEFVTGSLVDVAAVSFNEAWGVGLGSKTIWYQSPKKQAGDWKEMPAGSGLDRIAVCNNRDIYATASDNTIYRGIDLDGPFPSWDTVPRGWATDVACKNNNLYVIGVANDDIWVRGQWDEATASYWNQLPGAAVRIG